MSDVVIQGLINNLADAAADVAYRMLESPQWAGRAEEMEQFAQWLETLANG
jgi:hypothetical protein